MGRSTAERMGQEGYRLVLADRAGDSLAELAGVLKCQAVVGDLRTSGFRDELAAAAPRLDALVITAGLSQAMGSFEEILDVNLAAVAALVDRLAGSMVPGGCAVLFASMAAHRVPELDKNLLAELDAPLAADLPGRVAAAIDPDWRTPYGAYALSKVGIIRLARRTAVAWALRKVRACSISPGAFHTPMHAAEAAARGAEGNWWVDQAVAASPAGRFGEPEEVAAAAAFLCSPDASFVNGCDLLVDGGWIAAFACAGPDSPLANTPLRKRSPG
jgi:NAD(P)-dependent dehydrogenase (short-subunit alcohol dehydrogenase family)